MIDAEIVLRGKRLRGLRVRVAGPRVNPAWDASPRGAVWNAAVAATDCDVFQFRGIPYAAPLTGLARWSAPVVTPDLPSDPYDARTFRAIAPQTTGPTRSRRLGTRDPLPQLGSFAEWDEMGVVESEEGQTLLDVFTPLPVPGARLPVRVIIHSGGGTENPRCAQFELAERIAARGSVVVHVEYPLSTFGYFTHPDFGPAHQPNLTVQCVLAALEWVQVNIAAFGGDPGRVLIEGASHGGAICALLMPQGGTLFHNVLAISGNGVRRTLDRAGVTQRGAEFWGRLVKGLPAAHDPARTIQAIADQDGVAAALRLGPSVAQILSWGNDAQRWQGLGTGAASRFDVDAYSAWPVTDGDLLRGNTVEEMTRWPLSVGLMASWAANEASLIGNAFDVSDETARGWIAHFGITDTAAQDAAIAAMPLRAGDRWQRALYGASVYGVGVDVACRLFEARGGRAWAVFDQADSLGNGGQAPGHAAFSRLTRNKPEHQVGQAADRTTLRQGVFDVIAAEAVAGAVTAFGATGDPAGVHDGWPWPELLLPEERELVAGWRRYGTSARWTNVLLNAGPGGRLPEIQPQRDHWRAFHDLIDAGAWWTV